MNNYVDNIFAGAWDPVDVSPLPVHIPMPTNQQSIDKRTSIHFQIKLSLSFFLIVVKCAQLLSKAKRPLILMGSQSTLPPVNSDELVRAIRRLGIPCYLGGMSRGLLGPDSPLQAIRKHCFKILSN